MKKVIKFSIAGNPQAQKRARITKWSNYDPSADAKKDFLILVYDKRPQSPILGAIKLTVKFTMPRPMAHYGTGKNAGILKSNAPTKHIKRPDVDNNVKFILDSLSKIYWKDDSQIWMLTAIKVYGENPKTDIKIEYDM